jgi:hypothetical protein
MKTLGLICGGLALAPAMLIAQAPRTHELTLTPEHVHWGYYDPSVKPVLRIASGDTVRVETMIARGLQRLRAAGVKDDEIPEALKVVERAVTERGPGAHPMSGPIWVEGAEPGDSLEVKIVGIEFLHPYGVSGFIPGGGTLPTSFPTSGSTSFASIPAPARRPSLQASPSSSRRFSDRSASRRTRWSAASRADLPARTRAISTTRNWSPDRPCTSPSTFPVRSFPSATDTRCRATAR